MHASPEFSTYCSNPSTVFHLFPPEWIYLPRYSNVLLKLIAVSRPLKTTENITTKLIYVTNVNPKSKSHSCMSIRRRRVRRYPCTRKTGIRRKKNALHLKLIKYSQCKKRSCIATCNSVSYLYNFFNPTHILHYALSISQAWDPTFPTDQPQLCNKTSVPSMACTSAQCNSQHCGNHYHVPSQN